MAEFAVGLSLTACTHLPNSTQAIATHNNLFTRANAPITEAHNFATNKTGQYSDDRVLRQQQLEVMFYPRMELNGLTRNKTKVELSKFQEAARQEAEIVNNKFPVGEIKPDEITANSLANLEKGLGATTYAQYTQAVFGSPDAARLQQALTKSGLNKNSAIPAPQPLILPTLSSVPDKSGQKASVFNTQPFIQPSSKIYPKQPLPNDRRNIFNKIPIPGLHVQSPEEIRNDEIQDYKVFWESHQDLWDLNYQDYVVEQVNKFVTDNYLTNIQKNKLTIVQAGNTLPNKLNQYLYINWYLIVQNDLTPEVKVRTTSEQKKLSHLILTELVKLDQVQNPLLQR